jgi:hypothetical protein
MAGPASTLTFVGTILDAPSVGNPSGTPSNIFAINCAWQMAHSGINANFDLTSDSAKTVSFEGLPSGQATFVMVTPTGGSVDLTLTSGDGSAQIIPCDRIAIISSSTVPFTALTLTRSPGVEVVCQVYLANGV